MGEYSSLWAKPCHKTQLRAIVQQGTMYGPAERSILLQIKPDSEEYQGRAAI